MERNIKRKEASHMDNSIGNSGLSSSDLAQVLPSVPAMAYVALQHARAASSGPQKPETSAETRQGKGSKGLVEEVAFANAIAEFLNQQVSFSYDERVNQIVVKVTKGDTEEVIRQIPSEEMIELITRFRKDFRGLIFNRTG
jgi:flagellar protein FlaG